MRRLLIPALAALIASILVQAAVVGTGMFFPSDAGFSVELRYVEPLLSQAEFLNRSLVYQVTIFWPLAPGARSLEIALEGVEPASASIRVLVSFRDRIVSCGDLPCIVEYEERDPFIYIKIYLPIEGGAMAQASPQLKVGVNRGAG